MNESGGAMTTTTRFCFNCDCETKQVRSKRVWDAARWFCIECGKTQVVSGLTERDDGGRRTE